MSKIDVYNTAIVISDYELGSHPTLENYFKIKVPVTKTYSTYRYFGIHYDEENKKLYLPRGIDIWLVEKILGEEAKIHVNEYIKYDKYDKFKIKNLPRDDVQKKALRFMLGKEEYRHTAEKSQLSVNLNTGKGKTYLAISTIVFSGIKTMIIMYSENLIQQWKKEILKYTNLNPKQVCIIEGSNSIHRLMAKNDNNAVIYLVTHGTLKSYGDRYGWKKVGELFEYLKVGIKIFDEAHQNFENMLMIDYYTNVYRTYYLTATSLRSSENENRVYQLSFKNVPYIDLFDQDEDPHTVYTAIKFHSKPTAIEKSECKNQYGLDRNKYTNYLVSKPIFYKVLTILMNIILKRTANGGKCLIYIGTNSAIEKAYNWMSEKYPELYNNIGILSTLADEEHRVLAVNKRIILSTTKSAGAGLDIKGLKLTVVLAEPFKSEVLARQTLGRTRDNDTEYIELVDIGFPQCSKYYSQKKHVFLKYALSCREMVLKDDYIEAKSYELNQSRIIPTWDSLFKNNNGVAYYEGLVRGVIYQNELIKGVTYDE